MLINSANELGLEFFQTFNQYSAPIFVFRCTDAIPQMTNTLIALQLCGRYGEWAETRTPFVGHEDADVILTFVSSDGGPGQPIFSAEFNDAIPAGNNAWQRFPRIAQAANEGAPFIYELPICDAEIYGGEIRSIRHPNVIMSLGQLALMAHYSTPSLTIFSESPWYSEGLKTGKAQEDVDGTESEKRTGGFALLQILLAGARALNIDQEAINYLEEKEEEIFNNCMIDMLSQISFFGSSDFTLLEGHPIQQEDYWEELIESWWRKVTIDAAIPDEHRFFEWSADQFKEHPLPFTKATSTDSRFKNQLNPSLRLLSSAKKATVLEFAQTWDIQLPEKTTKAAARNLIESGPQSWRRPLSYKPPSNEVGFIFNVGTFADLLEEAYPDLSVEVIDRCLNATPPILFLPIAGYVEDSGGVIAFSRPDKGLVGLMATLFGQGKTFSERIVLMYHQEIPDNWIESLDGAIRCF